MEYVKLPPLREADVEGGRVRGIRGNNPGYTVFKGIPYAAPPVGDLRWRRPAPVIPWEGVRICDTFGAIAPQPNTDNDPMFGWDNYPPLPQSEDCLYLNVWTPAVSAEQRLPVFVTIHGGAFVVGSGASTCLDGEAYCREGIVKVTFNYRMGALGYMAHPELSARDEQGISGNYGLYDQLAALRWVKNNIAAFGGDPGNVTIAGQSAGAGTVLAMTVSPLAEGLFQKGIVQSGFILGEHSNCNPPALQDAEAYGLQYMREIGCESLAEMLELPPERINFDWGMMVGRPFLPVNDGIAMLEPFYKTISEGRQRHALYLYGNTSEEMGLEPGKRKLLLEDALAFADAQAALGRPTWLYCFSRRLPTPDNIGAAHAAELWYEYGTLGRSRWRFNGNDYQVSLNLIAYWANFMRSGDPNGDGLPMWRPYNADKREFLEINDNLGMRNVTQ
ncbi:MAG: carboxylesterase family protein [Oscillospiraceae bacterium]|jgi:para-nitrobenzyl esterase|nr:carboxylesterase family protein [Oscillospiraceae bacterium]